MPPAVEVQSLNWVKFHLREVPGLLKWASKLEQGEKKSFIWKIQLSIFGAFPLSQNA